MDSNGYLGLAGSFTALFVAAALPALPYGRRRTRLLLAALLALLAEYGLGAHLTGTGGFERFPHLQRVGSTLGMLFMPLLYFYARSLARPDQALAPRDAWHLLPLLLQTLLRLPFFLASAERKLQIHNAGQSWDILTNRLGLLVQALAYGWILFRLTRRHEGLLAEEHSRLEGRHLHWVLALYASWVLVPFVDAAQLLAPSATWLPSPALVSALLTLVTAYLGLIHLDAALPAPPSRASAPSPAEPEPEPLSAPRPTRPGPLSPERECEILERVRALMERESPHLEPDLSLADLAQRLRLPPSYLSRALNNQLGRNFFTFVNQYRVEAARSLLLAKPDQSILDVALETGFASKSTFNTVFKKLTGMTPSDFRKTGHSPEG